MHDDAASTCYPLCKAPEAAHRTFNSIHMQVVPWSFLFVSFVVVLFLIDWLDDRPTPHIVFLSVNIQPEG